MIGTLACLGIITTGKFVADAVSNELERLRRTELRRSLDNPHVESGELADASLKDWVEDWPAQHDEGLVDQMAGIPVRWVAGQGWFREEEKRNTDKRA